MTRVRICAVLVATSAHLASAHPPDPFAADYLVPDERDVGTTAGQVHFIASSVLGHASQGTSLGGQLTFELMTIAVIGIRSTLHADMIHSAGDPSVFAARVGPSLHLLPYRRFDLSVFVEGGVARVGPAMGAGYYEPMLSPGIGVQLWLTPSWFVGVDAQLDWFALAASEQYVRASGVASVGLGL
jgi:hypothetical protein